MSDILGTDGDIIQRNLEEETDKKLLVTAMNKLNGREKDYGVKVRTKQPS